MSFIASLVKQANSEPVESSRKELEGVMSRIYDECPWKWPFGLSINAHDEIYMIREASTGIPAGFTGWQERTEGLEKVGFYTIGMLPEHRGQGMAKAAVTKLLLKKSASVDRIQALIAEGNTESVGLAQSLGVDHKILVKKAGAGHYLATALLGGAGNAVYWDQVQHPDVPLKDSLNPTTYDKSRGMLFGLNALLGAGGGLGIHKGVQMFKEHPIAGGAAVTGGIGTIALSPTKDLVMKSMPVPDKIRESLAILDAKNQEPTPNNDMSTGQKVGIGAALAAALGAGAYGVNRLANSVDKQTENGQKARVKVTLPTRDANDHETVIDAPVSDFGFSARVYNDLARDTKRRLRGELNERKMRRKPRHLPAEDDQVKAAAQTPPEAPVTPSRTPWAVSYSEKQLPTPEPDADLTKQVEEAHAKIDELSTQLKSQKSEKAPAAPAATTTQTTLPSIAAVNSRIATALKLIGSNTKSAAVAPPKPAPTPPPAKAPLTVGQLQNANDLGNRTFRGKPGIQTPFTPFSVPFGQTAYQFGNMARRAAFGSPGPSASAQFMEETPPNQDFGQQIATLVPSILQGLA